MRPGSVRIAATLLAAMIFIVAARAGVRTGADRAEIWRPLLEGRRVALLSNHTGLCGDGRHIADAMVEGGINVVTLLSPEHGFRGTADAGEHVAGGRDAVTGLPVVSMYTGRGSGLTDELLDGIDVIVVDLQDVGARFYTYYITMLQAMNAAARAGKSVIVLDRPNPLGMTVDGPVLDMALQSGVGKLPMPVIHGMTMGELALMANGEGWLSGGRAVGDLKVVECEGYTHSTRYALPVAPSPNLKTMEAIYLYPSLCLFEGTPVSVGRGTEMPFTVYGHPQMKGHTFTFTPQPRPGAKTPPLSGRKCYGADLRGLDADSVIAAGLDLSYIIDAYRSTPRTIKFFTPFFDKLAGTRELRRQIEAGKSADEIRRSWAPALERFGKVRAKYLLYEP